MENITWGSTYNYKPSFFVKTMTNGPEKPVKTDELISRPESKGARDRGLQCHGSDYKKNISVPRIWSNPTKWIHFGVLSATVGVTLYIIF